MRCSHPDPILGLFRFVAYPSEHARVVGVDAKTLRKHYREELDLGETKANAQVAGLRRVRESGGGFVRW
jgi:hypothetical protein